LTATITNLLFAPDRVPFLAPADRSPHRNRPEAALNGPDARSILAVQCLSLATPSNVCGSSVIVETGTGREGIETSCF